MSIETSGPVSSTPPWWTDAVVYQIYPRSFADSNGDGVGDLAGIRSRLDHLQQLGVDVLWLSPIYRSPQADNGYDISDYRDIDPLFGTLAEFDALLSEVHERGMKLVMDLVVNHTSDEHAWFEESRSSLDSPKRDWYVWRDGHDGREPNLWRSAFGGAAWDLDETTGQYYLHLFATKQPDLNWENPEVRAAVYEMMNWWLDRGVDGFRMDVINYIAKVQSDLVGDSSQASMGGQIHDFLQEMNREVFAGRDTDLITVGEMPGVTVEDAVLFTGHDRLEIDMVFQFEHVGLDHGPDSKFDNVPLSLVDLKRSLGRWQDGLAESGWNSLYLGNHDQPRSVSRFGDDGLYRVESATMLATVLHLHRGTPYVYQGDEIGMTNAGFTAIEQYQDIESVNYFAEATAAGASPAEVLEDLRYRSRDNARTPVQWDATEQAGFTTGSPWLEVNPNHVTVNAAADRAAGQRSVFEHYRRLIALRHGSAVVALGDFAMLEPEHPTLYAFTRTLGDETLLVVGNFSGEALEVSLLESARAAAGTLVIGNYETGDGGADATLRPWEARVIRLA
ncbi:glycoside hydrolase family 13 protein [Lacisediminihabitans profunda]|uniref:Alpha-glucosidase n=1 Tax=Lacisediminihabitans profunda TaxID=2594790 RepID=A0A5C8UXM3_9MICO|nr:alpha-glucosidase [Lacisediminihabitans profunda]TXN32863.1 alpha-glucosidase [Lacisediminihabitans profunda]